MNQRWQTIVRSLLTGAGAYLIGHHIFNIVIDASYWDTVSGTVLSAFSLVWGIANKTYTEDAIVAAYKQISSFASGILVASGKIDAASASMWGGLGLNILTSVLSIKYKQVTK